MTMPRGGAREKSGRKSTWRTPGGTTTIRIPIALAERLLEVAHLLDRQGIIENETKSNKQVKIDLSGIKVYQFRKVRDWVCLSDLLKKGYILENVTKSED